MEPVPLALYGPFVVGQWCSIYVPARLRLDLARRPGTCLALLEASAGLRWDFLERLLAPRAGVRGLFAFARVDP